MVIILSLLPKLIGESKLESKVKIKNPHGKEKFQISNNFGFLVCIVLC